MNIGSPSEEKADKKSNNERTIQLKVGRQANLEIRGTAATDNNAIENDLALLQDNAFLRSIKLEVGACIPLGHYRLFMEDPV